jgi:hypothetical protein
MNQKTKNNILSAAVGLVIVAFLGAATWLIYFVHKEDAGRKEVEVRFAAAQAQITPLVEKANTAFRDIGVMTNVETLDQALNWAVGGRRLTAVEALALSDYVRKIETTLKGPQGLYAGDHQLNFTFVNGRHVLMFTREYTAALNREYSESQASEELARRAQGKKS